jgi:hypothetical protein
VKVSIRKHWPVKNQKVGWRPEDEAAGSFTTRVGKKTGIGWMTS